jgi:hypothetical protein
LITYVFDIDGTICENTFGEYHLAKPFLDRIKVINDLFDAGNRILFLTARGMGSSGNNESIARAKWQALTESQLDLWGVKYHYLYLGKPSGDIYIDDKGKNDRDFFAALKN